MKPIRRFYAPIKPRIKSYISFFFSIKILLDNIPCVNILLYWYINLYPIFMHRCVARIVYFLLLVSFYLTIKTQFFFRNTMPIENENNSLCLRISLILKLSRIFEKKGFGRFATQQKYILL